jgi:hypothetical protein
MPSTLNTFASNEVSLRFREPFLTAGINRSATLTMPRGIYKGFAIGTNASALTLTINPATINGVVTESVAIVYADAYGSTSNDLAFTVRRNTAFNIDVSQYVSQTVVLGLFVTHVANSVVGPSTVAEIRAYTVAEYTALTTQDKLTFVPMGQVVVPASGVIAASAITPLFRMEAWENIAPGAFPWSQLVRNSGFEGPYLSSPTNRQHLVPLWETTQTVGTNSKWASGTALNVGNNALVVTNSGATETFSGTAFQRTHVPIVAGQSVRIRLTYRVLSADTTGTAVVKAQLSWLKTDTSTTTTDITLSNVVGSATTVDQVVAAPALAAELLKVIISVAGWGCSAAVDSLAFEDFQVFCETQTVFHHNRLADQNAIVHIAHPLILDSRDPTPSINAPLVYFDSTTPAAEGRIIVDRLDQATSLPPVLHHFGRLKLGDKNAASNLKPDLRAKFDSTITYPTLIAEYGNTDEGVGATKGTVRHYASQNGDFIVTVNAKADTSFNWTKDINGLTATKVTYTIDARVKTQYRAAANNAAWADSGWDGLIGLNPVLLAASGTPDANTAYPTSLIKAWATFPAGSTTPATTDGFNISSIAVTNATPSVVTVTLLTAMADANYSVFVTGSTATQTILPINITKTTTTFSFTTISLAAAGSGANINWSTATGTLFVKIVGRQ